MSFDGQLSVLMVIRAFHPIIGGAEKQAQLLAESFIRSGIHVEVVTSRFTKQMKKFEIINEVPVNRINCPNIKYLGNIIFFIGLFVFLIRKRIEYDIYHVHQAQDHCLIVGLFLSIFNKRAILKITGSGDNFDINKLKKRKIAKILISYIYKYEKFIVFNKGVIGQLIDYKIPSSKIKVIPNGIEISELPIRDIKLDKSSINLITIGRLEKIKNIEVIVRALPILMGKKHHINSVKLLIIGDGPEREYLKKITLQEGVIDNVIFEGYQNDPTSYLLTADIFILSSWSEGMSNTLLEAMASGIPIIASDIPSNKILISHLEHGLLFPPESADDLADRIIELTDDDVLSHSMAANARLKIETEYNIDYIVKRYTALYSEIIK